MIAAHPYAALGALLAIIGLGIGWLVLEAFRRAAKMPSAKNKSDALAESFASASEQSKAQARAMEIRNAPDSDVDARVDQLRARGRNGK